MIVKTQISTLLVAYSSYFMKDLRLDKDGY